MHETDSRPMAESVVDNAHHTAIEILIGCRRAEASVALDVLVNVIGKPYLQAITGSYVYGYVPDGQDAQADGLSHEVQVVPTTTSLDEIHEVSMGHATTYRLVMPMRSLFQHGFSIIEDYETDYRYLFFHVLLSFLGPSIMEGDSSSISLCIQAVSINTN